MTALTLPLFSRWARFQMTRNERAQTRADPPRPPAHQPVFIYDAVTPWRGETLLAARLKEDIERALQDTEGDT